MTCQSSTYVKADKFKLYKEWIERIFSPDHAEDISQRVQVDRSYELATSVPIVVLEEIEDCLPGLPLKLSVTSVNELKIVDDVIKSAPPMSASFAGGFVSK